MIFCREYFVTMRLVGHCLSLSKMPSSVCVWSFIIMFTYQKNCYFSNGPLPSNNLTCGQFFNKWLKTIHGKIATTIFNFDPTSTLGIEGLGCHRYWPIGAWTKFESPSIDFKDLATLGLEGLGCTTLGALVLVTLCGPTPGSIVISLMSSTTILGGLMNGSTYMFEVFINVCCASNSRMMIQINGVFELLKGNTFMEPIDCMGAC